MAALIFHVASVLYDLHDIVNIFLYGGCSIKETLCYYKKKKQLQLYYYYMQQYNKNNNNEKNYIKCIHNKESDSIINCEIPNKMANHVNEKGDKCLMANTIDKISLSYEAIDINDGNEENDGSVASANEYFEMIDGNVCTSRATSFEVVDFDSIEVINAFKNKGSCPLDYYEELVYSNPHLVRLHEGVSFTISGTTKKYCERFSINFIIENPTRDIALHISPRLPQNYVVRNSKIRNMWGPEEVASPLPFNLKRGETFAIQILFTDKFFMIGINGFHFCKYQHRLPYRNIKTLEVKGDVEDYIIVERMRVDHYPFRSSDSEPLQLASYLERRNSATDQEASDEVDVVKIPREWRRISLPTRATLQLVTDNYTELQLPFWGTFPKGIYTLGRVLKVDGRVKLLPQSFTINMQTGTNMWPHPIISLHLNARFSKQHSGAIGRTTMIRNAWKDGGWGPEERSDIDTEFRPGKSFSLSIVHGINSFEMYVNHRYLTNFKFRTNTYVINAVYIVGDIKLWNVTLENQLSFERVKPPKYFRGSVTMPKLLSTSYFTQN